MKSKAVDCESGELLDSPARDRIVCGITNDQVRGRLLRKADLTLDKTIDMCRASEITTSQDKALTEKVEINRKISVNPKDNFFLLKLEHQELNKICQVAADVVLSIKQRNVQPLPNV